MIRRYPEPHEPYDGSAEESPIAKMWHGVLTDSLKRGCRQIHIFLSDPPDPPVLVRSGPYKEIDEMLTDEPLPEPSRKAVIRWLVDDAWEEMIELPSAMYPAFLQRLKVMAGFSLARRPPVEQGRFHFELRGAVYEITVTVRVGPDGSQEAMVDLPSAPLETAGRSS